MIYIYYLLKITRSETTLSVIMPSVAEHPLMEQPQLLPVLWGIVLQYLLIAFPISRKRDTTTRNGRGRMQKRCLSRKDWEHQLEPLIDAFFSKREKNTIGVQRQKTRTEFLSVGHKLHDNGNVSKCVLILQLKVTQSIIPDETHYPVITNRWRTYTTECIECKIQFFGDDDENFAGSTGSTTVSSMYVGSNCIHLILGSAMLVIGVSPSFRDMFDKKVVNLVPGDILHIK